MRAAVFSRIRAGREASLAGRVVAITGAASGIGRAVALECARRGALLALSDIRGSDLATLGAEVEALGARASSLHVREVDVRQREQVFDWAAEVSSSLGPTHALVNAAGVALHCPLDETSTEDLAWVMDTNFWGTVHAAQAFLPQIKEAPAGHVVNISSVLGLAAFPASGGYVASKFAVRGFTEALAIEMSLTHPHVRVTSVHPGGIKTQLVRRGRVRGSGPLARDVEQVALAFDRSLARLPADDCARAIVEVMLRPRARLLIGADARIIDWTVRLFPSFYQRLLAGLAQRKG